MAHVLFYFVLSICVCAWTWPYIHSSWLGSISCYSEGHMIILLLCLSPEFFLIFWISLMFLHMELFRKKWAANSVCAAIIWVDSIYAREYYIANGVWMLQNQQQGRRRSRGTWALPNSNGGGGAWHPGKHGEATNRKNPPGGYVLWVNNPLLPN